nr:hypothetical protein [uncultured Pantoea sp.]
MSKNFILSVCLFISINVYADANKTFEAECKNIARQAMTEHPELLVEAVKQNYSIDALRDSFQMNCEGFAGLGFEHADLSLGELSFSNIPSSWRGIAKKIVVQAYNLGAKK